MNLRSIITDKLGLKFIIVITSLSLFGIVMLLSTQLFTFKFFLKQMVWLSIGIILFIFFATTDYRSLRDIVLPLTVLTFMLLIYLLFTDAEIKRWIRFKPLDINFQPSELARFTIVLYLAHYFSVVKQKNIRKLIPPLFITFLMCLLILLQPDFGTPVIIFLTATAILFITGTNFKTILLFLLIFGAVAFLGIKHKPYRAERIDYWIHKTIFQREPTGDKWTEHEYQTRQLLRAMSSGGIFGRGIGKGEIKKHYLSTVHTDFPFALICEETGLIGAIFILFLFSSFVYLGYKIALSTNDMFGVLLICGFVFSIALQACINIYICCGLLPTKGLPLPFFSYGGSSLIFLFSSCGVCMNIALQSRWRRK